VFAIIGDNLEDIDNNNNLVINPANITTGANHMGEGDTTDSVATRAKVQLTVNEWKTIKAPVNNGAAIPIDARREVLSNASRISYEKGTTISLCTTTAIETARKRKM
jgi:spore germination protein GerM